MTQTMKSWLVGSMTLIILYLFLMLSVLAVNSGDLSLGVDSTNTSGILIAGEDGGGFDGG